MLTDESVFAALISRNDDGGGRFTGSFDAFLCDSDVDFPPSELN